MNFKEMLIKNYNSFKRKVDNSVIKYSYSHKNVKVRVYFDASDYDNLSLVMLLIYGDKCYYSPLRIGDKGIYHSYLPKIPDSILERITNDGHLDDFYDNMTDHLSNDEYGLTSYENDRDFQTINKIKDENSKSKSSPPFLYCIRKKRMSDKMLKLLNQTMNIDENKLKRMQAAKLTIVRTADIRKRKTLTAILENYADIIDL